MLTLDLSCVLLNDKGARAGEFFFGDNSLGYAFSHSGDMMNAPPPSGATEAISVKLAKIAKSCSVIYFVVTAFNTKTIGAVDELSASIALRSSQGFEELKLAGLSSAPGRAFALCRLVREEFKWSSECLSNVVFQDGETVRGVIKDIQAHYCKR